MNSKEQYKVALKKAKELNKTLITRNEVLERELTRVRNLLYNRSDIQPTGRITSKDKTEWSARLMKRWHKFWK